MDEPRLARLDRELAVDLGHEGLVAPVLVLRAGEVDVLPAPHRLDDVHDALEVVGRVGLLAELDVLRTDAEQQLRPVVDPLGRVGVDVVGDAVGRQSVAIERDLEEVHRRAADEPRDERVRRAVKALQGCADLLELAVVEDREPVAHRHRLGLVVGDVDRRDAELALEALDLGAHLRAELRVEVRERLVHQEGVRVADGRPPDRHALFLPAGELAGVAVEHVPDVHGLGGVLDPAVDLVVREVGRHLQPEAHVPTDRHVRVERVVLEHHRDVALAGFEVADRLAVDRDLALGLSFEPRDHPEERRLPAPRGADHDQELVVLDREVDVVDRDDLVASLRERLRDAVEFDSCH
ncbi:phenol hydroxylase [Halococcus hamelinensis 100A6]|uniref:Phenol hydroxylase n=1 Tax=Halococcus hamelinensis 100A6 TaxID=1132509 RepID=M0LPL4_9EURY|nr:phenol hydroxylase [Halococcus hamelinensis 100A6]